MPNPPLEPPSTPIDRPWVLSGRTHKLVTGCGNLYITVNRLGPGSKMPGAIVEVFAALGKSGACTEALISSVTRLISLSLRSGVPVERVVRMLRNVRCPAPFFGNPHLGNGASTSCVDAIARVLELELELQTDTRPLQVQVVNPVPLSGSNGQCPECGGSLVYQEGCFLCHSCGYERC